MNNSHNYLPCPSCGASLRTAAEIASHVCPGVLGPDPSPEGVKLAERIERTKLQERQNSRQPTLDELGKDTAKIVEIVHSQWDGEVDVMILMAPKGSMQAAVAWTGDMNRERARNLLTQFKKRMDLPRKLDVPQ